MSAAIVRNAASDSPPPTAFFSAATLPDLLFAVLVIAEVIVDEGLA